MREKVVKTLKGLGFSLTPIDDIGYKFEFEGTALLYSFDGEDTNCLTITIPNCFDVTDENRVTVLEAMARLCAELKYVQPQIFMDRVWLSYQHFVGGGEVTEEIVEHMVRVLDFSVMKFYQIINGEEDDD